MARILQIVQEPGEGQDKRGIKHAARPKMLQRQVHAADPVGFLLQMIQRPHQKHVVKDPEPQGVQVQAIRGVGRERKTLFLRFFPGETDVAGRQIHQRHRAALLCIMESIPSRSAADVENRIPRPDVSVHHPGGQGEFKRMGVEPFPFPLRRFVVIPLDRLDALPSHSFSHPFLFIRISGMIRCYHENAPV